MSQFTVKCGELGNQAEVWNRIGSKIDALGQRAEGVSRKIDTGEKSLQQIRERLSAYTRNSALPMADRFRSAGKALQAAARFYAATEASISSNAPGGAGKVFDWSKILTPFNFPVGPLPSPDGKGSIFLDSGGILFPGWLTTVAIGATTADSYSLLRISATRGNTEASLGFKNVYGEVKTDLGFGNKKQFVDIEPDKKSYINYAYDKETGQMVIPGMAPEYAKKGMSVLEGELKGTLGGSLLEGSISEKGDWGEYNVKAEVGTAELHGELSGGLYVFDKSGNKKLVPSVNAEVGVGVCALSVAAAGNVGSDSLGLYGQGEIDVGKLEAKIKGSASVLDKDGNVNIQAKAEMGAEAIAFEAKGKAGVDIGGVKAGVTGGITVGVGAHAEAGIVDGVVKVDIGVSAGIGINVGFEVDVGGAVKAVTGAAESAIKGLVSWFS